MRQTHKRPFHPAFLALLTLVIMTSVVYLRYCRLVRHFPTLKSEYFDFPLLTNAQILHVGWAHGKKPPLAGSYLDHTLRKTPGTIRIGVFGCSFTQGFETARGHDFPTFLRKMFLAQGDIPVEVINFGHAGYGLSQMYLLWEDLGTQYDLDYVIVFPLPFHHDRDRMFRQQGLKKLGRIIHSRFILAGHEIKRLDPLGTDPLNAADTYYRFLTPWQYLRYDINMPLWLQACLPAAFQQRTNPFYYKRGQAFAQEMPEIYKRLFTRWSAQTHQLIILTADNATDSILPPDSIPGALILPLQSPRKLYSSLLRAAGGHNSALLNHFMAQELFSFFDGDLSPQIQAFKTFQFHEQAPPHVKVTTPLHEFTFVDIKASGKRVGQFYSLSMLKNPENTYIPPAVDITSSRVVSLLHIRIPSDNMRPEGVFATLPFFLPEQGTLTLKNLPGTKDPLILGSIDCRNGIIGRFSPRPLPKLHAAAGSGLARLMNELNGNFTLSPLFSSLSLAIDGVPVFAESPSLKIAVINAILHGNLRAPLEPLRLPWQDIWYIGSPAESFPKFLTEVAQPINLVLSDSPETLFRIPLFRCEPATLPATPFPRRLSQPIPVKQHLAPEPIAQGSPSPVGKKK